MRQSIRACISSWNWSYAVAAVYRHLELPPTWAFYAISDILSLTKLSLGFSFTGQVANMYSYHYLVIANFLVHMI